MTDRAITIQHMIKAWNDQPDNATIEDRMGAAMDVALAAHQAEIKSSLLQRMDAALAKEGTP